MPNSGIGVTQEAPATRMYVEASLPVGVECGLENFAGDDQVKSFVEGVNNGHPELAMEVWVHWCGPPDVSLLRLPNKKVLLRSERFDVLLIEYFNLIRIVSSPDYTGDAEKLIRSAVSKWFSELFLGMREPRLALRSFEGYQKTNYLFPNHTYRDEALDSVPRVDRAALQCYSLAHEIAHIIYPKHENTTLDFAPDQMDIRSHLTWEMKQAKTDLDVISLMVAEMEERMDFDLLATEIDADVSALGTIASYLPNAFPVSRKQAFQAALFALQAQSFINHCKHSCRLVRRHYRNGLDRKEFNAADWIEGQYIVARTRVALRRAGILWYHWDKDDGEALEPDQYRAEVDSLLVDVQPFLLLLSQAACDETERLYDEADDLRHQKDSVTALEVDLAHCMKDQDARLSIFNILVAMGYPGSILHDLDGLICSIESLGLTT